MFGTSFLAISQSGLLSLLSQVSTWILVATLPITVAHFTQMMGPMAQCIARHIILLIILPTAAAFTLFPQSIVTWLSAQPLRITPERHIHPAWLILLLVTLWAWLDYRHIALPITLYIMYIAWILTFIPTRTTPSW